MTIASQTNRVAYTGNGVSVDFAVSFPFHSATDLVVVETVIATGVQTTKTITTHYTVSGTPDSLGYYPNGGTVTAVTAPASTVTWTIYRDPPLLQSLNLSENNALPAESLEAQLDYLTMLLQRLNDIVGRSLRQPDGDSADIDPLPSKIDRASTYLAFDADGDPIATEGTTEANPVSAFMATVLDDTTAAAARTTLGASATGAVTGSGLTQATARILGRTTASTGAVEEISVGNGLTLSAGTLTADSASETVDGILELATQAEVNAMTDTARAITPNHNRMVLATAVESTSGTSIDFTGIPSGVRRISIMVQGVSSSGTTGYLVQLGDSGGIEATGYLSSSGYQSNTAVSIISSTDGFAVATNASAATTASGTIVLTKITGNTWTGSGNWKLSATEFGWTGGEKSLSAELDRIRVATLNGVDTFDAGTINIVYER